jgi:hypothetical protein
MRAAVASHVTGLLVAAVALGTAAPAAGQGAERDEAGLAQAARRVDASASRADAGTVEERLVATFSGVRVKPRPDAAGEPLSVGHIRTLRARGLGYGEIAIVLALYANQSPSTATFRTLEGIADLEQPHRGWGEVARLMYAQSLGAVKRDVRSASLALEKAAGPAGSTERTARPERVRKPERPSRPEKLERRERPERLR